MVPTPRVPIQSTPSIRPLHVTTSMGPRPWNLFSGTLHGTPSIEHPPCEPLHRITSRELPARDPLLRTPAWDPLKGTPYKGPLHKSHSTGPIQVTRPCGRLQGPLPEEPRGAPTKIPPPEHHYKGTLQGTPSWGSPRRPWRNSKHIPGDNQQGIPPSDPLRGLPIGDPSLETLEGTSSREHLQTIPQGNPST